MTSASNRFTMSVESGLHAGASQTLGADRYILGSSVESDIVLLDGAVEPRHAAIQEWESQLHVEPLGSDIVVDGGERLRAGTVHPLRMPVSLVIGDARLTFSSMNSSAATRASAIASMPLRAPSTRRTKMLAGGALVGLGLIALIAHPLANVALSQRPEVTAASVRAAADAAAERDKDTAPRLSLPKLAANAVSTAAVSLREQVDRAGLLNITIDSGSGVIAASGSLDPKHAAQWQTVQQWFDERFGGDITLVNDVRVKEEKVPVSLALEGVWRGPNPHLLIRGQKYMEGAVLDGGWSIEQIEAERVLLQKQGRLVAVRY